MALTTITQYPFGWLPYGSDDDAVIVQNPLTSSVSAGDLGFTSITKRPNTATFDANITHDSNGFLANGASYQFNTFTDGTTLLDGGFQISIEVQKEFVCWDSSANGSTGDTVADEILMAFTASTSATGNQYWVFNKLDGATFSGRQFGVASMDGNVYDSSKADEPLSIHSIGKDDYITLRMGYLPGRNGGTVFYEVDGLTIAKETAADSNMSGLLNRLYLGSGAAAKYVTAHYMRNFQIAKRPPTFPVHPKLRKVVLWGDSQTYTTETVDGVVNDNSPMLSFLRAIQKKGFYTGEIVVQQNSGYSWGDWASHTSLNTTLTTLENEGADVILIRAGSNDFASSNFVKADFDTEIKSQLTTILGWASTQNIIISTVPTGQYNTSVWASANQTRHTDINDVIKGLEAWDTTGKIKVIDTYSYLGGESPQPNTYIGQQNGLSNNIHFAARGGYLQGKHFAEAVLTILS